MKGLGFFFLLLITSVAQAGKIQCDLNPHLFAPLATPSGNFLYSHQWAAGGAIRSPYAVFLGGKGNWFGKTDINFTVLQSGMNGYFEPSLARTDDQSWLALHPNGGNDFEVYTALFLPEQSMMTAIGEYEQTHFAMMGIIEVDPISQSVFTRFYIQDLTLPTQPMQKVMEMPFSGSYPDHDGLSFSDGFFTWRMQNGPTTDFYYCSVRSLDKGKTGHCFNSSGSPFKVQPPVLQVTPARRGIYPAKVPFYTLNQTGSLNTPVFLWGSSSGLVGHGNGVETLLIQPNPRGAANPLHLVGPVLTYFESRKQEIRTAVVTYSASGGFAILNDQFVTKTIAQTWVMADWGEKPTLTDQGKPGGKATLFAWIDSDKVFVKDVADMNNSNVNPVWVNRPPFSKIQSLSVDLNHVLFDLISPGSPSAPALVAMAYCVDDNS